MEADSQLREIPIRQSLVRPHLVLQAERELVLFSGLICVAIIFTSFSVKVAAIGICLWVVILFLLRLMGKADPKMSKVYSRHTKYKAYYHPFSTPYRTD